MLDTRYVKLDDSKVDELNAPRILNQKEVKKIIDEFPKVHGVNDIVRKYARKNIEKDIMPRLFRTMIPSKINELQERIYAQHYYSQIPPGTAAGCLAGEAAGASSTQATLNTFHTAGSKNSVSSGIDGLRELFYAKKTRGNESCSVYFKNRYLSLEEIYEKRSELIGSRVSDFVSNYEILRRKTPNTKEEYYDKDELVEDSIWSEYCEEISGMKLPVKAKYILRLHLNLNEMVKQNVTTKEIADSLCREKKSFIVPVYGPMKDAILDIYPTKEVTSGKIKGKECKKMMGIPVSKKDKEFVFLENCLVPCLSLTDVKGISGIKEIYVDQVSLVMAIYKERKAIQMDFPKSFKKNPNSEYWVLFLNKFLARLHGFKINHVSDLVKEVGIEPVFEDLKNNWVIVEIVKPVTKLFEGKQKKLSPIEILNDAIASDEKLIENNLKIKQMEEKEEFGKAITHLPTPTNLLRKAKLLVVETEGSNLLGLCQQPDVDSTLTTCNNIYTTTQLLGIENAYNLYISELDKTIASNRATINPVHIITIADFVMIRGIPRGTNFSGVSKQAGGPLELASIERAGKVISEAALFGNKEIIKGISSSIVVNARIEVGTGASNVGEDIIENGMVVDTLINEDIYKLHSKDNFGLTEDQILDEINKIKNYEDVTAIDRTAFDFEGPEDGEERFVGSIVEGNENFKNEIVNKNIKIRSNYKKYSKTNSLVYNKSISEKDGYYISEVLDLSFLPSKPEKSFKIVKGPKFTPPKVEKVVNKELSAESEINIREYNQSISKFFD